MAFCNMERKYKIILPLVAFIWFMVLGNNGQSIFFGTINMIDEGQFAAWVGHMLQGQVIYNDFYVQYGPLMIYPIYLMMKLFGVSFFYIRLWSLMGAFLGYIVGIYALNQLRVKSYLFWISAIALLIIPGIQIRQWIGILVILLLKEYLEKKNLVLGFLTGVMVTLAVFQSFEIGLFVLIVLGVFSFFKIVNSNTLINGIKFLYPIYLGLLASFLLFVFLFYQQGWLKEYISTTLEFASSVSGMDLPNGQGLPLVFQKTASHFSVSSLLKDIVSKNMLFYWSLGMLTVIFSILFIRVTLRNKRNEDVFALFIALLTLLIYVSIIGRSGHYITVFPFLVVLGAYICSLLQKSKKLYVLSVLIFVLFIMRHIAIYRFTIFPIFNERGSVSLANTYPLKISHSDARDINQLKEYLDINTKGLDSIYVLNNTPALYFLLNRRNATKFDLPLLAGTIDKRMEVVNELKNNKPGYIIEDEKAWSVDGIKDSERMPEVFSYVHSNYRLSVTFGRFSLYKIISK